MGLLGDNLPPGYEIRETARDDGNTEYTIWRQNQKTYYTTFKRKLAVTKAKEMYRVQGR